MRPLLDESADRLAFVSRLPEFRMRAGGLCAWHSANPGRVQAIWRGRWRPWNSQGAHRARRWRLGLCGVSGAPATPGRQQHFSGAAARMPGRMHAPGPTRPGRIGPHGCGSQGPHRPQERLSPQSPQRPLFRLALSWAANVPGGCSPDRPARPVICIMAGHRGWTNERYADRQEKWVLASPTSAIAN
jgi:hypothetical protein